MNKTLKKKYLKLIDYLKNKNIIVSYSGGKDSLLLSILSSRYSNYSLSIMVNNGFISKDNIKMAEKYSKEYDFNIKIINYNFLKNDIIFKINENLNKKCYYCKKCMGNIILKESKKLKDKLKLKDVVIVDGTNCDDIKEDRLGLKAYKKLKIISPYLLFDIDGEDVKNILKYLNVDIPQSDSCLATRILNPPIIKDRLKRIERSEKLVRNNLNIKGYFRLRDYDNLCIFDINEDEINKFFNIDKGLIEVLKKSGFKKCLLDLK